MPIYTARRYSTDGRAASASAGENCICVFECVQTPADCLRYISHARRDSTRLDSTVELGRVGVGRCELAVIAYARLLECTARAVGRGGAPAVRPGCSDPDGLYDHFLPERLLLRRLVRRRQEQTQVYNTHSFPLSHVKSRSHRVRINQPINQNLFSEQ